MAHAAAGSPEIPGHIAAWIEKHIAPDIERVKADIDRIRELAPGLQTVANLVVTLAKADPGISPAIVAGAEEAAEIVARAVAELGAAGL